MIWTAFPLRVAVQFAQRIAHFIITARNICLPFLLFFSPQKCGHCSIVVIIYCCSTVVSCTNRNRIPVKRLPDPRTAMDISSDVSIRVIISIEHPNAVLYPLISCIMSARTIGLGAVSVRGFSGVYRWRYRRTRQEPVRRNGKTMRHHHTRLI